MNVTLNRNQIDDAIQLGQTSLSRFAGVPGRYSNTFNSHTLGRFGEIGVASLFEANGYTVLPHYRDLASLKMCDVEVLGSLPYSRLEVKTWGAANWQDLGRCIHVGQLAKIQESADAVVWCTVPTISSISKRSVPLANAGSDNPGVFVAVRYCSCAYQCDGACERSPSEQLSSSTKRTQACFGANP